MPYFMIDDQMPVNRKAQQLARTALRNDLEGPAALGMWMMAGGLSQAALSDGVVSVEDLVSIMLNYDVALKLADHLVAAGLWHAESHECERCPAVEPGQYLFHDWFALGYARGDTVKVKRDKSKELKSAELIAAVWARDCTDDPNNPTRGRCRYCARELHRSDRKSDYRPTMDHVDPRKAVGAVNVVLACWDCNRRKAAKTPEQAGMTLLPAPRAAAPQGTVSPAHAAAETPAAQIKPQDQTDISQIPDTKSLLGRAHEGERVGRAGVGQGGAGSSNGSVLGQPASSSPKPRNRRRGRGKGRPQDQKPANPHHAGEAPPVPAVGTQGSPWHGWQGKRSEVDETTCDIHGEEQPCRTCIKENQ